MQTHRRILDGGARGKRIRGDGVTREHEEETLLSSQEILDHGGLAVEQLRANDVGAECVGVARFGEGGIAATDFLFDVAQILLQGCGVGVEVASAAVDLVAQRVLAREERAPLRAVGACQRLAHGIEGQARPRTLAHGKRAELVAGGHHQIDGVLVVADHPGEQRHPEALGRQVAPPRFHDVDHLAHVVHRRIGSSQRLVRPRAVRQGEGIVPAPAERAADLQRAAVALDRFLGAPQQRQGDAHVVEDVGLRSALAVLAD